LSTTVRPLASLLIETAFINGNAAARSPCMVTVSPGLIAKAICV